MKSGGAAVILAALRDPRSLPDWSLPDWELLVRQARRADLLARLAVTLDELGLLHHVSDPPRVHLESARAFARAQADAIRREVDHIIAALKPVGVDVVLLKGAAYLCGNLPAAAGRVFADVDILVPKRLLPQVEAALMLGGWATTHHNAYDQRYYRQWMHELPPMRHTMRLTILDVHHAILPQTAHARPDPDKLLASSVPVPGVAGLRVLAPVDMVLHSATHLFYNEEFTHGLRDLLDLDSLLRHFAARAGFWDELTARATELDLVRPLYYALRYASRMLGTPVPVDATTIGRHGRAPAMRSLMDALFLRALRPDHASTSDAFTPLARRLLYVRGHWLRMPPHLLALHLTVKALRRESREAGDARV
jgi:hypothetical protein